MRKVILLLLTAARLLAADPPTLTNVGTIYSKNWVTWDMNDPRVTSYRIYFAATNAVLPGVKYADTNNMTVGTNVIQSPFHFLAEVPTNRWPGLGLQTGLNGTWAIAATAVAGLPFTDVTGANVTVGTNMVESVFSEVVALTFRDGIPLPASNLQLYSVLLYAGTNALPALFPPELAPSGR